MNFTKNILKIALALGVTAITVASALSLQGSGLVGKAEAQRSRDVRFDYMPSYGYRSGTQNYHRQYQRHVRFYRDNRYLVPREIYVYDRGNSRNRVILRNYLTGPGSYNVNRVYVRVGSDDFRRLDRSFTFSRDIDIYANTGDNTVSFNTVVGSISTGDVDISVW